MRLPLTALLLVLLVVWLHAPLFHGGLLGASGTDVYRAVWGFDHQTRGLPLPFWTDRVGFPAGEKLVILPFFSTLLGAPLHLIFGAWTGYNLWMLSLLVLSGVATAWWVEEVSKSPSAGLMAGVAMVVQPSVLLALTDGTPEHVAFWALPALLCSLWITSRSPLRRWPIIAGVFATIVALDSPYHAIFAIPLVPFALWRCTWRGRLRFGATALAGAALVAGLYYMLPLAGPLDNRWDNAAKLSVWWQWDMHKITKPWDHTYTPAFIPALTLVAATILAFFRPARTWPWLLFGLLCIGLALGAYAENGAVLARWWPGVGKPIGAALIWLNDHLAPTAIRFPRRWLVPAALCFWTAAGIGLSRLPKEWMRAAVGVPVALGAVAITLWTTGYREGFPSIDPPAPAFATFIAEHGGEGAALLLPAVRGASRKHERFELPIYASLDESIRSSDLPFLQVAIGRKVMNAPTGLFTMIARHAQSERVTRFVQDLNDLCTPQTMGMPIAPSATQEPQQRVAIANALVDMGLRFVVLDEEAYGVEGLAYARLPFKDHLAEERHFADGTGVTVFVLQP
ncbi:hypothetical protein LBMAG42_01390 [Deltaproteobacteria bacterium]|nr:hypothetical protein LBMAG42_01390 [Deltaproteobacteria bacterium]